MQENVKQYEEFVKGVIKMPNHLAPQKVEKGVLFKSSFMEKYVSRTPIWVVQVMWLVIAAIGIWYSYTRIDLKIIHIILFYLGGVLFWTFAEYIVHRFLYHTETNSKFLYRIQYNAHGIHHLYPRDPDRLAMPPLPGIILASVFLGIFWIVMKEFSFPFFAGFMTGYVAYISFHYAQHRFRPAKPFKKLWEHHAYHHYKNPHKDFGVSSQLWDWVFGTISKPEKKK